MRPAPSKVSKSRRRNNRAAFSGVRAVDPIDSPIWRLIGPRSGRRIAVGKGLSDKPAELSYPADLETGPGAMVRSNLPIGCARRRVPFAPRPTRRAVIWRKRSISACRAATSVPQGPSVAFTEAVLAEAQGSKAIEVYDLERPVKLRMVSVHISNYQIDPAELHRDCHGKPRGR